MHETLSQVGDTKTCVLALIINENMVLLGLRHYKEISVWIPPGGRCSEGETLESTLRREVEEEIGVNDLSIMKFSGKLEGLNTGDTVFTFLCDTNQKEKLMEPNKFSEWKWFDKEAVKKINMNESTCELIYSLLQKSSSVIK